MALATKETAIKELLSAEMKMEEFLKSDAYIPIENGASAQEEIERFKMADWQEKSKLMNSYIRFYSDKVMPKEQRELIDQANMSVLIGKFIYLGIPTEIIEERQPNIKTKELTEPNYYREAVAHINKLRSMDNIEKCEHKGRPLLDHLARIQFKQNDYCSKGDMLDLKKHCENLERYNYALQIISELETKAFPPAYKQDFAFKIAKTIKSSRVAMCSENQLSQLIKSKNKLIAPEISQMDMFTIMNQSYDSKNIAVEGISR